MFDDLSLLHIVALFPTVQLPSNHNSNVVGLDPFPHPPKLAIHAVHKLKSMAHCESKVPRKTMADVTVSQPSVMFSTYNGLTFTASKTKYSR
ncbi:hypothetical protein IEQ34_001156 [Dendrobium chrysotoxum]|uniref:Uncharacterized protein n=1 Tax=Dendrobium chrysotoxum TaxID=161865 RepID=A0AAV7HPR1_DENCH|nr:hypothetical protein IEQ34_001156 [Dendrobium chrysotoxum]